MGGVRCGGGEVQDQYGSANGSDVDRLSGGTGYRPGVRNWYPDNVSEGGKRKTDPAVLRPPPPARDIFPEVIAGI